MTSISDTSSTVTKSQASLPPTSLIIPTRNRPELLYETVKSILDGDEVPTEIIIIDQSKTANSMLATLMSSRMCMIRYVLSNLAGLSRARNAGIAVAQNDILVFIDDDMLVAQTWFGDLVRALLGAGPSGVVTGRVLPVATQTLGGFTPATKKDITATIYSGRVPEDVLLGGNMALFGSAFSEVGFFDVHLGAGSAYPAAEDNDFGFRLLEAGYQIHYIPKAIVYHRAWRTAQDYIPMRWNYGFGQGAFYAKYFKFNDRFMYGRMWADLARHGSRLLQYSWKRSFRQNYSDVVYILGLVCGAARWLLTQRKMN